MRLHGQFYLERLQQSLSLKDNFGCKSTAYTVDFEAGGLAFGLAQTFDDDGAFLNPQRLHLSRSATSGTGELCGSLDAHHLRNGAN